MKNNSSENSSENAVSPVIGVMLMLVVTIVIVGFIGVYVNNMSDTSESKLTPIYFDTELNDNGLRITYLSSPATLELDKDYFIAISQPNDLNDFVLVDYTYDPKDYDNLELQLKYPWNIGNLSGIIQNVIDIYTFIDTKVLSIIDSNSNLQVFDNGGVTYNLSTLGNKGQNIASGWITESGDQLYGLPYTVNLVKYDGTKTYGTTSGTSKITANKTVTKPYWS